MRGNTLNLTSFHVSPGGHPVHTGAPTPPTGDEGGGRDDAGGDEVDGDEVGGDEVDGDEVGGDEAGGDEVDEDEGEAMQLFCDQAHPDDVHNPSLD